MTRPLFQWTGLLILFSLTPGHSTTLTEQNQQQVQRVLDRAVEAHGGQERLAALNSLIITRESTNVAINQSRKTEPPWDTSTDTTTESIDLERQIYTAHAKGQGIGFQSHNQTIIHPDRSLQIDHRARTMAEIESPDFNTTSGPFIRVTPILLLKQLIDHQRTAFVLGDVDIDGSTHDVIGFSMAVGPAISLYVDRSSGLIRRSERLFPGFGLIGYRFEDYESIEGLMMNRTFRLIVADEVNTTHRLTDIRINPDVDAQTRSPEGFALLDPIPASPMSHRQLAEGVWLIGGNNLYGLFVEMEDHVIAIGGTGSAAERIAELRTLTQKPLRYGAMTHHHSDHVLAVPDYQAEGAIVLAAQAHEQVVRAAASDERDFAFEAVSNKRVFKDDQQTLELIDIGPTSHTEHLLVAWLPEHGILFEADHFSLPATGGALPAITNTADFARQLDAHGLSPRVLLSAHSGRSASMDDLKEGLARGKALSSTD